jgi:exopolysaccharide biosynthesis polyprenyl glycosylphosphotransferase
MNTHTRLQSFWIISLDLICLIASILLAATFRFGPGEMTDFVLGRLDGWLLFVSSIIVGNYVAGNYRVQFSLSRFNLVVTWLFSVSVAILILSLTSYAWLKILLGRGVLGLAVLLYSVSSLYLRVVVVRAVFRIGGVVHRALVMLDDRNELRIRSYIQNPFVLPQHVVSGWLRMQGHDARKPGGAGEVYEGVPVIDATPSELPDLIRSLDIGLVVTSRHIEDACPVLSRALRQIRFAGVEVLTPLAVCEQYCGRVPLDLVDETDIGRHGFESQVPVYFRIKRFFDLFGCVLGCVILVPAGVLVALAIKISEPRVPVLFRQERNGQFGRRFMMYKFRTMRVGADVDSGPVWSPEDDARITPLGHILRMFRLDEIPQVWNVFKGDMSLVGPRPEQPALVEALEKQVPFYREREYALPGLTGWAQVNSLYGNSVEATRRKVEYDLYYIKNMSLSLDLQVILRTFRIVLLGKEKRA